MRALLWIVAPAALLAQTDFQQKGYVEYRGFGFPEVTYNDKAHVIGEALKEKTGHERKRKQQQVRVEEEQKDERRAARPLHGPVKLGSRFARVRLEAGVAHRFNHV